MPTYPSSWLVEEALSEIGVSAPPQNADSEGRVQSGMVKLHTMLAEWSYRGIRIGFPINVTYDPGSATVELPDGSVSAVVTNLALRLAPGYGRPVMIETKVAAKEGINTLLSRASQPREIPMPGTMPAGAGNRPWAVNGDPFLPDPVEDITIGGDAPLEFN